MKTLGRAIKTFSLAIFSTACAAYADTNEPVKLIFTNGPPAKLYTPTPEQKRIEGRYFQTTFDAFEEKVTHMVINLPDYGSVLTALVRQWSQTDDHYMFAISRTGDLGYGGKFDDRGEVRFLIDGQRWFFTNTLSGSELKITRSWELQTSFYCRISKEVSTALGNCRTATVRVPKLSGNFDYTFTPQELKRFALFVRTYIPENGRENRPAVTLKKAGGV
jgi:hypothetical protein